MSTALRVAYDDQIVSLHRRGGISRYFVELVRALQRDADLSVRPVFDWQASGNDHVLEAGYSRRWARSRPVRRALRAGHRLRAADVVHPTFYGSGFPTRRARPVVVTVFDMIPEVFPELFPGGSPHLAKQDYVHAADLVLCISESARADLLKHYGPLDAPVRVTPLAPSGVFQTGSGTRTGLPRPYVLFVGSRSGYKDFGVAADAVRLLRQRFPDLLLVAVGGDDLTPEESRLPFVIHARLSDAQLAGAYSEAVCLAFPSRYEGFGLPTLEAMSCRCPAVLADVAVHREVGGDAALYFAAGDSEGLAGHITRLLQDPDFAATRVGGGLRRAQAFSWSHTARLTASAYHEVAR